MVRQYGMKQNVGLLFLRVVTGVIFVAHGWPKLANGASGTAQFLGQLGVPAPAAAAWLVTVLEFFGGLALIVGAFVVVLSSLFVVHMAMGILLVHLSNGFYVVGPGQGGVEFNLLLIASLLTLILVGPGKPAVDEARGGEAAVTPGAGGAGEGGRERAV